MNLFGMNAQPGVKVPPTWLIWFFDSPMWDLFSFALAVQQQFPSAAISSWWRDPGWFSTHSGVRGAARLSSHPLGLALDLVDPGGQGSYDQMGSMADDWFPGDNDGWWSADYSEGNLHFHIQRWTGWSPDWISWVSAFVSWDPRIGPWLALQPTDYQNLGLA